MNIVEALKLHNGIYTGLFIKLLVFFQWIPSWLNSGIVFAKWKYFEFFEFFEWWVGGSGGGSC